MHLTIDFATKILSDKMQVHLIRPGARYAFRPIVLEQSLLPADAPFLDLEDGKGVPAANKITSQLERARELRVWANASKSSRGPRPSTSLETYKLDLVDPSKAITRTKIRNAAQKVLWGVPGGTLVVIPPSTLSGDAILAEIVSRKAPRTVVSGVGLNSKLSYPARGLKNLKLFPMRDLPEQAIKSARTVRVVEKITGHAEDRLLRMYYGDYQKDGQRVAGLIAGTEDFDARVIGQVVALHMAVEHALKYGGALKPGEALFDPNVLESPNFHARVDSPDGRAHLESGSIATFVVKIIMVVAASGIAPEAAAQAIQDDCVTIVNADTGESETVIEASREALVDFAQIAGHDCVATYVAALQDGLNRNDAIVNGSATLETD